MAMDGIDSIHIHNGTDYMGENRTIRWTEVFFIRQEESGNSRGDPVDLSRLADMLSGACCIALTPHLDKLREAGLTRIGLRVSIDSEMVSPLLYFTCIGTLLSDICSQISNLRQLSQLYIKMNSCKLENKLFNLIILIESLEFIE